MFVLKCRRVQVHQGFYVSLELLRYLDFYGAAFGDNISSSGLTVGCGLSIAIQQCNNSFEHFIYIRGGTEIMANNVIFTRFSTFEKLNKSKRLTLLRRDYLGGLDF